MSEDTIARSLGQLPVAAFAVNAAGKIIAWNSDAEQLLSKTASQAVGKKVWSVLGAELKESVLSGESDQLTLEIEGKSVSLTSKPEKDDDGEVSLVIYVARPAERQVRRPGAAGRG